MVEILHNKGKKSIYLAVHERQWKHVSIPTTKHNHVLLDEMDRTVKKLGFDNSTDLNRYLTERTDREPNCVYYAQTANDHIVILPVFKKGFLEGEPFERDTVEYYSLTHPETNQIIDQIGKGNSDALKDALRIMFEENKDLWLMFEKNKTFWKDHLSPRLDYISNLKWIKLK